MCCYSPTNNIHIVILCVVTGVLPFGSTNTFANRLFPQRELEVERFCEASMAIIRNKLVIFIVGL